MAAMGTARGASALKLPGTGISTISFGKYDRAMLSQSIDHLRASFFLMLRR
jgi:hypothetical protein